MTRVCVVEIATGLVVNASELGQNLPPNCSQPINPPPGFLWVPSDAAGIGWSYANGQFVAPPVPKPTIAQQISSIDAQMAGAEQAKLVGRTVREEMIWGFVKEYLFYVMGVKDPLLATVDQQTQAIAALSNPNDPHYNAGFARLKFFDDQFVTARSQRAALVSQVNATPA